MHGGTHDCHTCDVSCCFKVTTWQTKEATGQNYYKATGGNYHTHAKHVILAELVAMKKQRENTEEIVKKIEEKKMRKAEMEKQQCGNMLFPAVETKGKHRRN